MERTLTTQEALQAAEATLAMCKGKLPPHAEERRVETIQIVRTAIAAEAGRSTNQKLLCEADILAKRFAMPRASVLRWMKAVGVTGIMDLMRRYPGKRHADAMSLAQADITAFLLEA